MRADARRNRDAILKVAADAFARDGSEASLEAIAREAGVGIGTLYRHFGNRDELGLAVYQQDFDDLCTQAQLLADTLPPGEALRQWMIRFARHGRTKRGLIDVLDRVRNTPEQVDQFAANRQQLAGAAKMLLDAAAAAGVVRSDVEPADVTTNIHGICAANRAAAEDRSERAVNLLFDGMRYGVQR